ncbi:MAG: DOPA 4,5-dioxygenase family protein [Pseudomonadales bacterium]
MLQNNYTHYHAHLYYDSDTFELAKDICLQAWQRFSVQLGRMHQKNVGPHPRWSCQIGFTNTEFEALTQYLESRCEGLSVLVHPSTGDDYHDHTALAQWIGEPLALNLAMFKPR